MAMAVAVACAVGGCASTSRPAPAADAPPPEPGLTLRTALDAYEDGELERAEEFLAAYREREPESFEAALYLGRVHFEQERYGDAVDRLEEAVALDDASLDAHLWLGKALSEHIHEIAFFRKLPMAKRILAVFERAVELDPESIEGHIALARYYSEAPGFAGGDRERSLEHARIVIDLDPVEGHRLLSSIYQLFDEPELAEQEVHRALEALEDAPGYQNREEVVAELERRLHELTNGSGS